MSRDTQETSSRGVFWEKKGSDRHAQLGGFHLVKPWLPGSQRERTILWGACALLLSPIPRLAIFKGKTSSKFKDKQLSIVLLEIRKAFPFNSTHQCQLFLGSFPHTALPFFRVYFKLFYVLASQRAVTLDLIKEFAAEVLWQLLNYAAGKSEFLARRCGRGGGGWLPQGSTPSPTSPGWGPPRCPCTAITLWVICTFLKGKTSIMSNLEAATDQNLRLPEGKLLCAKAQPSSALLVTWAAWAGCQARPPAAVIKGSYKTNLFWVRQRRTH